MSESERNPLDEPPGDEMELVVPFIVCRSQEGPYDDESFVAGFQAGQIDQMLHLAAQAGASTVKPKFAVRSVLTKQLELIAMNRGFPVVDVVDLLDFEDAFTGTPEWCFVTFTAEGDVS